jgi:hypothetical protein
MEEAQPGKSARARVGDLDLDVVSGGDTGFPTEEQSNGLGGDEYMPTGCSAVPEVQ